MAWCQAQSGTCDQILLPFGRLRSENCSTVSVESPLWLEGGSAVCSAITQWSESRRTCNHAILSHQRLPQPGGPGSGIYIPQEQGGPVIPPETEFPLRSLLRLAGLRWRYSSPSPKTYRAVKRAPIFSRQSVYWWRWGYQPYARDAFCYQEYSWYQFLLEAESTPGRLLKVVFRNLPEDRDGAEEKFFRTMDIRSETANKAFQKSKQESASVLSCLHLFL
jgi:hypothetical protein